MGEAIVMGNSPISPASPAEVRSQPGAEDKVTVQPISLNKMWCMLIESTSEHSQRSLVLAHRPMRPKRYTRTQPTRLERSTGGNSELPFMAHRDSPGFITYR